MPLRYTIDPQKAHVHVIGTGRLRMASLIAVVDEVAADPLFQSQFSVVFDLREADYTAELNDGDAFVAALKRHLNDYPNKFALVVPAHLHFLAKLYSVLAGVGGFDRMQCFTDFEEARRWCGIS